MYVNPPFVIRIVEEAEAGGDRVWRQAANPSDVLRDVSKLVGCMYVCSCTALVIFLAVDRADVGTSSHWMDILRDIGGD